VPAIKTVASIINSAAWLFDLIILIYFAWKP